VALNGERADRACGDTKAASAGYLHAIQLLIISIIIDAQADRCRNFHPRLAIGAAMALVVDGLSRRRGDDLDAVRRCDT